MRIGAQAFDKFSHLKSLSKCRVLTTLCLNGTRSCVDFRDVRGSSYLGVFLESGYTRSFDLVPGGKADR